MTEALKPSATNIWLLVRTNPAFVTAFILLVIAVLLALLDRVPAGSLVAGLFVVVTLFHYLPQMESFKAFGIEAKWMREASLREGNLRSTLATFDGALANLDKAISDLSKQTSLPPTVVSAIATLNSTSTLANSQIVALGQANAAITDAISSRGPFVVWNYPMSTSGANTPPVARKSKDDPSP
jgi:hypothetical protein